MIELVNLFDKIAYSKIILICASLKLKFKEKKNSNSLKYQ